MKYAENQVLKRHALVISTENGLNAYSTRGLFVETVPFTGLMTLFSFECSVIRYIVIHSVLSDLYLFLAHLSRRLTGELIGYPWIRRPSSSSVVVRPFTFSSIFSSETAWLIKAKFYMEPPWEGGTKVCINGPGHMTKMAAMPIYGKNLKTIFFSRTGGPISTKLVM